MSEFSYKNIPFFSELISAPVGYRYAPDVFYAGGAYHAYYHTTVAHDIRHATSPDGIAWTDDDENNPVLEASQPWENGSLWWYGCAWKESSTWYMLYGGRRGADDWPIGLAISNDGVNWVKEVTNPVLEGDTDSWDESELDASWVIKDGSTYHLWYNTYGKTYNGIGNRLTGHATSTNLINWTKDENNPIFTSYQFCPTIFKYGNAYYMLLTQHRAGLEESLEVYRATNIDFSDRVFVGYLALNDDVAHPGLNVDYPRIVTTDIERTMLAGNEAFLYVNSSGPSTKLTSAPDFLSLVHRSVKGQPMSIFSAYRKAHQTLNPGSNMIAYDNVRDDPLGGWDSANKQYVVRNPGYYHITLYHVCAPAGFLPGERFTAAIYKNGGGIRESYNVTYGQQYDSAGISGRVKLDYGDRIKGNSYLVASGSRTLFGSRSASFIDMELVKRT